MDAEIGALVEYRHLHKDGSWRVLESIGQRFSDESGTILAVLNTRDITGRKPVN
jgi:PAS domain-containing protein